METRKEMGFHNEGSGTDMETTTIETTVAASAGRGWADQTAGERMFSLGVFGLSTAIGVAFAYYLFADPTRLTMVWEWTRSLPLLVQLVVWLLFLPWMAALWIWTLPWAVPVKMVLVIGTLLFTEYLMWPFK